jgi:hypothetical protein
MIDIFANNIKRSLLESLHAYVKDFEIPNTREDLLAITSAILTFQQKQGSLAFHHPDQHLITFRILLRRNL